MRRPIDAYREGYEKGRRDNIAGHAMQALWSLLDDDPGGFFAAGYHDGAGGKDFNPPVEKPVTLTRRPRQKYEWLGLVFLGLIWFAFVPVHLVISLCRKQPNRSEITWRGVLTVLWLAIMGFGAYQASVYRDQPTQRTASSAPAAANPTERPVQLSRNVNAPTGPHEIKTSGAVCADPSAPCLSPYRFRDNDLSFQLPRQLVWQNNYYSANFYAVILKSQAAVADHGPDTAACAKGILPESERQRIQATFRAQKVFTSTFGCHKTPVWYMNTNDTYNFVAVYAGESLVDAKSMLVRVKATGQFPGANIRKMQVVLGYGE